MENQSTEWKETWHDNHLKTICAFANTNGGVLEIGRKDLFTSHTPKPYNPLIAGAFFRSGQIEAWGRGIERIVAVCKEWGKP